MNRGNPRFHGKFSPDPIDEFVLKLTQYEPKRVYFLGIFFRS
jgi:hypothetical protein